MNELFNSAVKYISEIVKFDSSQKPAECGAPFGKETAECLEYFLKLAASFGFETKNYDNYAGEVIFGEGEEFAILAHLDVVPAGSGWTHEPFGGEIDYDNRKIWGRGTMDDKGPAVCALLALKTLKDTGFKPKKKIKLIVGCNEENGWACIDYYNAHAHMPETGFSPDADFPVIYAEKGILHLKLKFGADKNFTALKGGERGNMVCDLCEVTAQADGGRLKKYNLTSENGKIVSRGKSAHGSTPELGVNAIAPILLYLGLDKMHALLFEDGFGIQSFEDETGRLTFSPNVIEQTADGIFVTCDVRYPATFDKAQILSAIESRGVSYEILHYQAPLYNDKNCELIKTLCGVYNEVTGKHMQPVAIGGGTYARALKCGAAFGPEEEGEEQTIHKPDEYITFTKIERCLEIYRLAVERLTRK
ncbi:MAG: Sapep family Mn(2+)-dependent dipeptidase [Clostridia bacterium]|nr:Sapep family Mn(2+)-dependent dipeptidase [Clostridia bacterium]